MANPPWRRIVREALELLASEDEQREYERKVPHVDVTKEFVESWFSDSYHPADPIFAGQFSESEMRALAEFNRFFEMRLPSLPASRGSVGNWLLCDQWRDVMAAAKIALDVIRPK
jgi:hypothetical protein